MGLLDLFGRRKREAEAQENAALMGLMAMHELMIRNGCDSDEIPTGHGKFGHDITNPIPVRGIPANTVYLSRLRTEDGRPIKWERIGSFHAENIESPIDGYRIFDQTQAQIAVLYISPYHKRISGKAPKGFLLS